MIKIRTIRRFLMAWKHQLYEIFRAEKWAIQSPGWERGHMIYPQSFKVSLMHTNFVTRSQKNLMFWIFFAQALLLLFKKRRKVSGQKMRTAYRIVRLLITFLGTYILLNHEFKQSTTNQNECTTHMVAQDTCSGLDKFSDYNVALLNLLLTFRYTANPFPVIKTGFSLWSFLTGKSL